MSSNTQSSYADTLADNRRQKPARKIWTTPGGVHPAEHKEQSLQLPLAEMDIPAELIYPLSQHAGVPAEPIVSVGERVLTGQLIASSDKDISANIHAASSGVVKALEARPLPHPSVWPGLCIVFVTVAKYQCIAL
jgi:electron transport complex protein RnfC